MKTAFAAAILALLPALASAECWSGHASNQAMSCAEGSAYDAETGTCVPVPATTS